MELCLVSCLVHSLRQLKNGYLELKWMDLFKDYLYSVFCILVQEV